MTRHFLTRHVESIDNEAGYRGGNSGLTERGKKQAQFLGEKFAKLYYQQPFSTIYSSPALRALQTSRIIKYTVENLTDFTPTIVQVPAIREQHYGKYEGKKQGQRRSPLKKKLDRKFPGGESGLDVLNRVKPFAERLQNRKTPCVVVSHVNPLGYLSFLLSRGLYIDDALAIKWQHGEIRFIDTDSGQIGELDI